VIGSELMPSWRYAWRMHRFRPARQFINLAGVLVGWGTELLPGIAAKIVFDHLTHRGSLSWLDLPLLLLAMDALAGAAVSFTLQATNGAFAYANAGMLQRNMLRRIFELPGGRALPSSPGEAISRFRDDTEAVVWYPIQFNNVIGSTVTAIGAVVVMASINPYMTLAVVAPLTVVVAIVQSARTRIISYRRAARERTSEVTSLIADAFAAVQSIQLAGAEWRVVERLKVLSARRRQAAVRDSLLTALLQGSFWLVNLGTGFVLVAAGRAMKSGTFTVGDLALFVYYLGIFQRFNGDIGEGLTGYQQIGVSYARMQTLMAGRPPAELVASDPIYERGPLPSAAPLPAPGPALSDLEVRDLGYLHPGGGGVEDVSFSIPRGSFTVVTGRVGSGKSTLLQAVLGLVPATGSLMWNGEPIADPASFMVPPHCAYTPQVPRLFSDTLSDNILLGMDYGAGGGLSDAVRLAVMESDLEDMTDGLETRIGSRGLRLSGGQIQRTAAARMFVRCPELIVCDDLSSALDVDTEAELWARVLQDRSRTVLAVSHRRAVLSRAHQVIVLRDGQVDDVGTARQLLARCEEMRRLWRYEAVVEDEGAPARN
jgi:ATP-binding cassette, subfamily B, bacterial